MATTPIRIRRRAVGGATGAPAALLTAEPAYNMADEGLYIGFGDDGAGNATTVKLFGNTKRVIPITGGTAGQVVRLNAQADGLEYYTLAAGTVYTAGSGLTLTSGQFAVDFSLVAALASPTFTGTPVAPTAAVGVNTTQIATTAYVKSQGYATLAGPTFTGSVVAPTPTAGNNTTLVATTAFVTTALGPYLTSATAASTYAPLASPALTGTPTAPTAAGGTNTTQLATTAFVTSALSGYATNASLASYAPLASPTFTGTPAAPTATAGTNTTQIATTGFVTSALGNYLTTASAASTYLTQSTATATYAPLASPALTGTPTAPTPTPGDSTTKIATTAFVAGALGAQITGINWKQVVRAVSLTNIGSLSGTMTVDGVALGAGDRVLLVGQSTASQNGIYVVSSGAWTRSLDMDVWAEVPGATVMVTNGTYTGHGFTNTNDPSAAGTLGTTAITFVEFTGATDITNGNGIAKSGNTLSVTFTGAGITVGTGGVQLTGTALALAGLTAAADTLPYFNAAGSAATTVLTAFGRSLIDDADAATARGTLGLGTLSTQNANAVAITGGTIDGVTLDGGTF